MNASSSSSSSSSSLPTANIDWHRAVEAYISTLTDEEHEIIQECIKWIPAYSLRCTNGFLEWMKHQEFDQSSIEVMTPLSEIRK